MDCGSPVSVSASPILAKLSGDAKHAEETGEKRVVRISFTAPELIILPLKNRQACRSIETLRFEEVDFDEPVADILRRQHLGHAFFERCVGVD
jgi:hypothetical protein